jgi:hypothetical protein
LAAANARNDSERVSSTLASADNPCANRAILQRIQTFTALLDSPKLTDLTLNSGPLVSGAFHPNSPRTIAAVPIDQDRGADGSRDCRSKTDPDLHLPIGPSEPSQ